MIVHSRQWAMRLECGNWVFQMIGHVGTDGKVACAMATPEQYRQLHARAGIESQVEQQLRAAFAHE